MVVAGLFVLIPKGERFMSLFALEVEGVTYEL